MKILTYNVRTWLRDPFAWKERAKAIRSIIADL